MYCISSCDTVVRGEYPSECCDKISGNNYLVLGKNYFSREALAVILPNLFFEIDKNRLNRILGKNYFYQKTLLVSLKSFLGLNLELLDLYCDLFPLQNIEGKISLFPLMY